MHSYSAEQQEQRALRERQAWEISSNSFSLYKTVFDLKKEKKVILDILKF